MRYYLISVRMTVTKKIKDIKYWEGSGEKETLVHCWWECKLVQPHGRKCEGSPKLKTDTAISLCGTYFKEMKPEGWRDICTPKFIAGLFIGTDIRNPPNGPSMVEWVKEMRYVCTIEYYSVLRKILSFVTWINLEDIKSSEINQAQKDQYCMVSLVHET
jgi:hypothetical protein